jgi:hypothetical protein
MYVFAEALHLLNEIKKTLNVIRFNRDFLPKWWF